MLYAFYEVLSHSTDENGSHVFLIAFNPTHPIFDGHFPAQKVVPGVCQMEIVRQLAIRLTGASLRLIQAANIKFTAMIDPDRSNQVSVRLRITASENQAAVESSIFDSQATFLKFKGTFAIDAQPAKPF